MQRTMLQGGGGEGRRTGKKKAACETDIFISQKFALKENELKLWLM